ncbi:MAG: DNA-processing protein DprA, partial [Clostridia bacterium]|nr:DNA-processing protein DprA [Clostridia bacterium]
LVTQAGAKSGTSITATAAGDYGRPIYAVPGSILDVSFKGCNEMIRLGAIPVTDPNHIILDYSPLYSEISAPLMVEEKSPGVLNLIDSKYNDLSDDELAILKCISGGRVHPDEITVRTGIDISMVNSVLTLLQMQELIIETDGLYSII